LKPDWLACALIPYHPLVAIETVLRVSGFHRFYWVGKALQQCLE